MSSGGNPPPAEVLAALVQTALLALGLAAIVLATRAMQVSFDKKQAERARAEAMQASRQRLRTLSERNVFYQSSNSPPPSCHADDCGSSLGSSTLNSSSGLNSSPQSSQEGDPRDAASVGWGSSCVSPPAAATGSTPGAATTGGAASLLLAASRKLLQRRVSARDLASGDPGRQQHNALMDRSLSMGGRLGAAVQSSWGAPSGGGPVAALLRKKSDSLLETSAVLGSVPQETITSTRQVLAAFNYDYSALHRRENNYVSGHHSWSTRMAY